MSKINITVDTSSKLASVAIDGKVVENVAGASYSCYEFCDCEGEKHISHNVTVCVQSESEDEVYQYTHMSWCWKDDAEPEMSIEKLTPASAMMAGILTNRTKK